MQRMWATRGSELCVGRVGLIVLVVGGRSWTNDVWREYCDLYASMIAQHGPAKAILNLSPGWGPDSAQRKMLTVDYREAHRIDDLRRFALISDSPIVRGIVTALSWVVRQGEPAAFAPSEAVAALAWLRGAIAFDVVRAVELFGELLDRVGYARAMLPPSFWSLTDAEVKALHR